MPDADDVEIRSMRPGDIRATVAMFATVAAEGRWVGTEGGFDQDRRAAMYAESLANPSSHRFLIAVAGGEIIASAHAQLAPYGVAEIGMAIAADWRSRGLGGRLLDALLIEACDLGAHKVVLQVWPHNRRAIRLYASRGFVIEGRLVRHYRRRRTNELWDSVIMSLVLDHTSPGSPYGDGVEPGGE
ncbi:MAG TPA: GNAT family N-acetyltransferase [Candidatus Binatia bacterium]|nr:GNAT family N-acetyltransferase [Candidatus Binatia bacterium]